MEAEGEEVQMVPQESIRFIHHQPQEVVVARTGPESLPHVKKLMDEWNYYHANGKAREEKGKRVPRSYCCTRCLVIEENQIKLNWHMKCCHGDALTKVVVPADQTGESREIMKDLNPQQPRKTKSDTITAIIKAPVELDRYSKINKLSALKAKYGAKNVERPKCTSCLAHFSTDAELRKHVREQHSLQRPSKRSNLNQYQCLVDGVFKCLLCPKVCMDYKALKTLRDHYKRDHELGGRFPCMACASNFKSAASLKRHVMKEHCHQGLKCNMCIEIFRTKAELNFHIHEEHKKKLWEEACSVPYSIT